MPADPRSTSYQASYQAKCGEYFGVNICKYDESGNCLVHACPKPSQEAMRAAVVIGNVLSVGARTYDSADDVRRFAEIIDQQFAELREKAEALDWLEDNAQELFISRDQTLGKRVTLNFCCPSAENTVLDAIRAAREKR